jgi:protein TonB
VPPKGWPLGAYFRLSRVESRIPAKTVVLSALFHVLIFVMPFPAWLESRAQPKQERERYQLTWYGPARDLPPLSPSPAPKSKALPSTPAENNKPLASKGADAYHPRQIVLSNPPKPNHPRQTLVQPAAPPEAPKVLPALPNIVQWGAETSVKKPRLRLDPALLRPKRRAAQAVSEVAAPELRNQERNPGALNIAASPALNQKPKMPLAASAVPRAGTRNIEGEVAAAPELGSGGNGGDGSLSRIIALSATPAPPAPSFEVPMGNLAARISISPEGKQPGSPAGTAAGVPGGSGGTNGGGGGPAGSGSGNGTTGPPGITISGGDPENRSTMSGTGSGIARNRPAPSLRLSPLPDRPTARISREVNPSGRTSPAFERYTPGAPPEIVLGPKRIYTLNVNMPNVNSAAGSWILHFAEMNEESGKRTLPDGTPVLGLPLPITDLQGPVALRKVDPKYPPILASARVQGEVVLYAIIRRDGSVDSIQLVKGVDPTLNQNAIQALAQWRFKPAERRGEAVELEALVYIPFRSVAP